MHIRPFPSEAVEAQFLSSFISLNKKPGVVNAPIWLVHSWSHLDKPSITEMLDKWSEKKKDAPKDLFAPRHSQRIMAAYLEDQTQQINQSPAAGSRANDSNSSGATEEMRSYRSDLSLERLQHEIRRGNRGPMRGVDRDTRSTTPDSMTAARRQRIHRTANQVRQSVSGDPASALSIRFQEPTRSRKGPGIMDESSSGPSEAENRHSAASKRDVEVVRSSLRREVQRRQVRHPISGDPASALSIRFQEPARSRKAPGVIYESSSGPSEAGNRHSTASKRDMEVDRSSLRQEVQRRFDRAHYTGSNRSFLRDSSSDSFP